MKLEHSVRTENETLTSVSEHLLRVLFLLNAALCFTEENTAQQKVSYENMTDVLIIEWLFVMVASNDCAK